MKYLMKCGHIANAIDADGKHFRAFINESVYTRSHEVIGNIHDNPELLEVEK